MLDFKKFLKVGKHYIGYLMSLGFKDLFINFLGLLLVVGLSLLVYIPVSMIRDILYKIIVIFVSGSPTLYEVFDLVFTIISAILCILVFVYLFNKRYEDVEKLKNSRSDNLYLNKDKKEKEENEENSFKVRTNEVSEELDLPKAKVERKKFN